MADSNGRVQRFDVAYCVIVTATVLALVEVISFPGRLASPVLINLALVLHLMMVVCFFVGVGIQLRRRRLIEPLPVAGCVVLTGIWTGVLAMALVSNT